MTDLSAHPIDSAIVDTLLEGLDGLAVSLPTTGEILTAAAAAGDPAGGAAPGSGVPGPAHSAAGGRRRGPAAFLSRRWPYLAGAVLLALALVGSGAALQYHPASGGSPSSSGPPVGAPSGSGSAGLGSTPAPSSIAPSPVPSDSPPSMVAGTPPPSTPVPATAAPTPPSSAASAPVPAPVTTAIPVVAATPTPAPTVTRSPTPIPTPVSTSCPHPNNGHACPTTGPVP